MISAYSFLASALLCAVFQIPILVAGAWLAARSLRRVGPTIEHGVWAGVLILCVGVPLLPVRHVVPRPVVTAPLNAHGSSVVAVREGRSVLYDAGTIYVPFIAIEVLTGLWILTVLYGALRLSVGLVRTRRLRKDAEPCALDDLSQSVWNDCCILMGVSDVHLLSSRKLSGPVTLTMGFDALIIPFGFSEEVPPEELRAALLHECGHIRRRDFRNNLLYQVLALPVQFHPAVWFVKQQLAATREMACDAAAVDAIGDEIAYGTALLRLATWMSVRAQAAPTHAVGIFDANVLEERIMRIRSVRSALPRAVHLALTGLSACIVGAGVVSAMASSVDVAPQANTRAIGAVDAPGVYTAGKDATAPELVFQVDPQYTQAARAAKVKGNCVIAAVVDAHGVPQNVHVTGSLRPDLDANAIAAVKQYRFKPGLHEGKPVPVQLSVVVNFQIF